MTRTLLLMLAQLAPKETLWQQVRRKSLPLSMILGGVLLAVASLAILRGRQTPAGRLPKSQRWLLLVVIAIAVGFSVVMVIRGI
jgi:hypothetical protein